MFDITIQRAIPAKGLPSSIKLKKWAITTLKNTISSADITIRIVDKNEMVLLNSTYRKKNYPTNVLSFPMDIPVDLSSDISLLGDIVICAEVIKEEAQHQKKTEESHWAHMVVHGTLHLLGFDHEKQKDAILMENEEIKILKLLGFDNPYTIKEEKI